MSRSRSRRRSSSSSSRSSGSPRRLPSPDYRRRRTRSRSPVDYRRQREEGYENRKWKHEDGVKATWDRKKAMNEQKSVFLSGRRGRRIDIASDGVHRCWGHSPSPLRDDDPIVTLKDVAKEKAKREKKERKEARRVKREKKAKRANEQHDGDEWVEITRETLDKRNALAGESDDDESHIIGPKLPAETGTESGTSTGGSKYGSNMQRGEAAAMAAFVADGKRIPRRGEIGVSSDDILMYEKMGYVMSGSRHRRMEAVRERKENQVYSAEEKKMLSSLTAEERKKKETMILNQFKSLIEQKTRQQKQK